MAHERPLTDKELRALVVDAIDLTLPQARKSFAESMQVEADLPNDHYAATLTNLLDAIFYLRFGGQWRATAAPHAFQPMPRDAPSRRPAQQKASPEPPSIIRNISRALFSE